MSEKCVLVGQSGGPTAAINASLAGVIAAAVLLQRRCPRSAREHMVPTPAQLKNDKQNM